MTKKHWLITGASKGLGLVLARLLLARGERVAVTSRSLAELTKELGEAGENLLPLQADLTDEASVAAAIEQTIAVFGHLDVVVNNAGYAQQGTIEALSDNEVRRNFDINVFAPFHVLRHVLPHLRSQRAGHIINIASIVGFQGGYAGWASYCASKFALAGLTETLAAEVAELGIHATVVYPGPVRTEFLSSGSLSVAGQRIGDYTAAQASLDLHLNTLAGQQAGDPEKLAALVIQVAGLAEPPLHLFAGKIANQLAAEKMNAVNRDLAAWKGASESTDFPE